MFIYRFINIVTIYDYLPYVKEIIDRKTEKKYFTVDPSLPIRRTSGQCDRTLMTAVSRSTEWVFVVYRLLAWCELIWEYEERWGNETDTQDSAKKRDTEKTMFKWMLFSTLIKRSRIVKIDQYINWITINFTMNHLLQDNLPESGSNV